MKYEITEEDREKLQKSLDSQIEVRDDAQDMIDMLNRMLKWKKKKLKWDY